MNEFSSAVFFAKTFVDKFCVLGQAAFLLWLLKFDIEDVKQFLNNSWGGIDDRFKMWLLHAHTKFFENFGIQSLPILHFFTEGVGGWIVM